MNKKIWWFAVWLLVLVDVLLGIGLWQPFEYVEYQLVVRSSNQMITVLEMDNYRLVYPTPDIPLQPGMPVGVSCNLGQWIPVLFDCNSTVPWKRPGLLITY